MKLGWFYLSCSRYFPSHYCTMSEKISPQNLGKGREIPNRRIADISNLPSDYSTTPGGSIFSTTPGGDYLCQLSWFWYAWPIFVFDFDLSVLYLCSAIKMSSWHMFLALVCKKMFDANEKLIFKMASCLLQFVDMHLLTRWIGQHGFVIADISDYSSSFIRCHHPNTFCLL